MFAVTVTLINYISAHNYHKFQVDQHKFAHHTYSGEVLHWSLTQATINNLSLVEKNQPVEKRKNWVTRLVDRHDYVPTPGSQSVNKKSCEVIFSLETTSRDLGPQHLQAGAWSKITERLWTLCSKCICTEAQLFIRLFTCIEAEQWSWLYLRLVQWLVHRGTKLAGRVSFPYRHSLACVLLQKLHE